MAHIYIRFDFGTDEEKAQQARHKLDGWKQAFRLDKRLLYKLDRPESTAAADAGKAAVSEGTAKPAAAEKSKSETKTKTAGKAKPSERSSHASATAPNGKVGLLVRLYFSTHEKLSEQRWIARLPAEEPFKSASPQIIHASDPEFEKADQQFESLE